MLWLGDATALTASVTGGTLNLPQSIYELDAPLNDNTKSKVFTQEVRLSGAAGRLRGVGGGFYSNNKRPYGPDLLVSRFDTPPAPVLGAANGFNKGTPPAKGPHFLSRPGSTFKQ